MLLTGLGVQLLSKHLPKEVHKQIHTGMAQSRSRLIQQANEEVLSVVLSSEKIIAAFTKKLLNCENAQMLAHALMAVEAIETGNMYIAEDHTLVSQGKEVSNE